MPRPQNLVFFIFYVKYKSCLLILIVTAGVCQSTSMENDLSFIQSLVFYKQGL